MICVNLIDPIVEAQNAVIYWSGEMRDAALTGDRVGWDVASASYWKARNILLSRLSRDILLSRLSRDFCKTAEGRSL